MAMRVLVYLAWSAAVLFASACDSREEPKGQTFKEGVNLICTAHIEAANGDANFRSESRAYQAVKTGLFLYEHLSNPEARKLAEVMPYGDHVSKVLALRNAIKKAGIEQCPALDLLMAEPDCSMLDKGPGDCKDRFERELRRREKSSEETEPVR